MAEPGRYSRNSAAEQGLACCHVCGRLTLVAKGYCHCCGHHLTLRKKHSLQVTMALVIAAMILYIPANVLPIMITSTLGVSSSDTILSGVVYFWMHGDYPIALIIFIASVVVPLAKLFALIWLCYTVYRGRQQTPRRRTHLYRITEFIGRWSMVDVFVVALMVALVQLGNLMSIMPGPAALAFAAVVIITMFAAKNFDPRLIWDVLEDREQDEDESPGG